jgi:hexulose-6-phosphate isomerase
MIKGISAWSLPGGLENTLTVPDALAQAEAAGFKAIELCIGESGVLSPDTSDAELAAMKSQIEASPVVVESLAAGFSWGANPVDDDPAVRQRGQDLHRAGIEVAGKLGLGDYLLVPGVVKSPISSSIVRYDHAMERAREFVASLAPVAEAAGVRICVENVWNGFFYSPLELLDFVNSFGSDAVGIYFDVGNVLGYHQHPPHWIELLGEKIYRVHIKDFKESVGSLDGFCDLLEGDVPWAESMAALRAVGYDKTVIAEMVPPWEGVIPRTSAAMDQILQMGGGDA